MSPSLLGVTVAKEQREKADEIKWGIYAKYARIGKPNHVGNIEDQRKHDDGDEPATSCDKVR